MQSQLDIFPNTAARDLLDAIVTRFGAKPAAASALLARFGSLPAIAAANPSELQRVRGMSEEATAFLGQLRPLAALMAAETVQDRDLISSWSALVNYVRASQAHDQIESFRVLFLNRKNRLLSDEVLGRGTIDHAPVYPREVAKRALALDASAVVLIHNHPSGDPSPSQADIDMTRTLISILKPFDVVVHDHLIIASGGTASLKSLGHM